MRISNKPEQHGKLDGRPFLDLAFYHQLLLLLWSDSESVSWHLLWCRPLKQSGRKLLFEKNKYRERKTIANPVLCETPIVIARRDEEACWIVKLFVRCEALHLTWILCEELVYEIGIYLSLFNLKFKKARNSLSVRSQCKRNEMNKSLSFFH